MNTYQVWSATIPMQHVVADTSYEARKAFSRANKVPPSECCAHLAHSQSRA